LAGSSILAYKEVVQKIFQSMKILLYAPEYRPNLSNMIRSAEFFGYPEIYIYDANGLLDPPTNKVSRADMNHLARVWTAGAIEFIEIKKIENLEAFLDQHPGRKIATYVNSEAIHLRDFKFQADDLLIMGPEKTGLPTSLVEQCEVQLYIGGSGQTDCLNVSVSLAVFLYAAQVQV
jgi:tRNA G18 (ribose-2'-O)-methylase SpoU